ncbi:uncharacterized protein LOC131227156 isoform X3 [Magnolia sinica]|uniref:uncharacterized protein LOC131227156 isoform X3 n=1 Tax=Magnolia sinica TaxID=86752 RepID=UPI00265A3854|nr:uncharacterized protein LOC131227156 isoform X3 [Magnolia sinica]
MKSSTANSSHLPILQSPFLPHQNLKSLPRTLRFPEFRFRNRRRRRLKISLSFDNFLHTLISNFPPSNPLDLIIGPALGIVSAASYQFFRRTNRRRVSDSDSDIGKWILFTSPTPFNRFVVLRCPTILFEDSELLEGVNERLVSEDRHFVNLNSGRIPPGMAVDGDALEGALSYQRVCIGTDDGGVVSLDWPANLDLSKEHGLDTTVLIVPGTTEGSMDRNIRLFVCRALQNGCFPIVMNPRGCAGSPLTTARLFTAADSDDICTAIQFINRSRPWTALTGIGWGYGANMLTKYLGEASERTPLTAAVCIDNPFDLEEATRSSPHHVAMDQKLTGGLVDILRSNKELFQGRTKGFRVEEGLSAVSVRDFDKAISMISYGFEAIEDFYLKSSTRQLVGRLKIPVLFIQWLSAVELALLKGRHPLLKDVDITINPSKGLALVEGRALDGSNRPLNNTQLEDLDAFGANQINGMLGGRYDEVQNGVDGHFKSRKDVQGNLEGLEPQKEKSTDELQQTSSDNSGLVEGGDSPSDSERSQSMQTAEVVMNMLDVTAPGALGEEQKRKVLIAMEQGETFVKALQGAVPEDVRGKLTAAVSDIARTQGANLNLGLSRINWIPNVKRDTGERKSSHGEISQDSKAVSQDGLDDLSSGDKFSNDAGNNQSGSEESTTGSGSELQPLQKSQKSGDLGPQQESSYMGQTNTSGGKDSDDAVESYGGSQFSQDKSVQASGSVESMPEGVKPNHQNETEKVSGIENVGEQQRVNQSHSVADTHDADDRTLTKEVTNIPKNEDEGESTTGPSKPSSSVDPEASSPSISASPGPSPMEKEGNDIQNNEDKNVQAMKQSSLTKAEEPSPPPSASSTPPPINVSQALDALTGFDDSTQMAVNSVFGVIENMIDQLEKGKDQDSLGKQIKNEDEESDISSDEPLVMNKNESEEKEASKNVSSVQSDVMRSNDFLGSTCIEECPELHQDAGNKLGDSKPTQNDDPSFMNSIGRSQQNIGADHLDLEEKSRRQDVMNLASFMKDSNKIRHVHSFPLHITIHPYRDSLYNEYLRKCIRSMMPNTKPLDLDSTHDLLLEYFPEDGQWKLLDQLESTAEFTHHAEACEGTNGKGQPLQVGDEERIIEPSYVILDNELERQKTEEYETTDNSDRKAESGAANIEGLMYLVKGIVLRALKVEVGRRLGMLDMETVESNIAYDMERVADAVAMAVICNKELDCPIAMKLGTLQGEHIISAISLSYQESSHLRKVVPVGVVVGSSLAALRKHFHVTALHGAKIESIQDQDRNVGSKSYGEETEVENDHHGFVGKKVQYPDVDSSPSRGMRQPETTILKNDKVMVGAVTAALGASALLAHHTSKDLDKYNGTTEVPSGAINVKRELQKEVDKLEERMQERNQNNIVTSLAEKAMSVAAPVVPTRSDGEVDLERLVAMLSDLGQKGGILRLVGKMALLWGGIRGALSLVERLISFLHIAERPLFQRILGFVFMVLVLWSPVVVPFLPTLVQNWVAQSSTGIAGYACIIGLYTAVTVLIMLWGKRIRGYENPLEQYGLGLTSSKLNDLLKGLMGGIILVLSIHLVNAALGCAYPVWSSGIPSSRAGTITWLKGFGGMLLVAARGIVPAVGVSIVEELLFRSWLPEEIAVDLGYHRAIIISGLSFSLLQRSLSAAPGLWLLSLALTGAKQRGGGNLSVPIGMRAGTMIANFILQTGSFLRYRSNAPFWVTGIHPWQPFGGVVGLTFCITLAILLYPRQSPQRK